MLKDACDTFVSTQSQTIKNIVFLYPYFPWEDIILEMFPFLYGGYVFSIKMKNKKYHTIGTFPIEKSQKEAIPLTQIHDLSLTSNTNT